MTYTYSIIFGVGCFHDYLGKTIRRQKVRMGVPCMAFAEPVVSVPALLQLLAQNVPPQVQVIRCNAAEELAVVHGQPAGQAQGSGICVA